MRNIFLQLRKHITLLAFIALQAISLWMLFKFNRFHHAAFLGVANEVTGRVNTQVDKLDDYFHQGEENKRVHRMNDSLLNLLRSNFSAPDTGAQVRNDSVMVDTAMMMRHYLYRDGKVVYNDLNSDKNYLQIDRGSRYGVKDYMAVLNSDESVVGQVVNVSPNFSAVMTLLNIKNSVSAALKRTGDAGKLRWDGREINIVTLEGIGKSVQVKVGDTVITSKFSYNYPPEKMIGTVMQVNSDPATGFYLLKVRTAVNFANVQQVFIVENLQRDEQVLLEKDTERKVEQQKRTIN